MTPTFAVVSSMFDSCHDIRSLADCFARFIREDPGRQSLSGSFKPIDEGEWAEQAYIGPTEKLFSAIVLSDRAAVADFISQEGYDLNRRDQVGRTPLQLAILSKEVDIA